MNTKRRGGSLCKPPYDLNPPENDIYTIDGGLETNVNTDQPSYIFTDNSHKNVIIKAVKSEYEYTITRHLNHLGFTPQVIGFYTCNGDVAKLKPFNANKKMFIVMEKINGRDLLEIMMGLEKSDRAGFVDKYMDEIYRLYNILMDKGLIHTDLYLQNIILGSDEKIYFIDFEYVINIKMAVPLEYRLSQEKLRANLLGQKKLYDPNPGKYVNEGGRRIKRTKTRRKFK